MQLKVEPGCLPPPLLQEEEISKYEYNTKNTKGFENYDRRSLVAGGLPDLDTGDVFAGGPNSSRP
jgi:hypothetical protein